MRRYTIKELQSMTAIQFAISVLRDRKSTTTNCHSPLAQKIDETVNELKRIEEKTREEA